MSHQRTIIVLTALMTAGLAAVSGFGAFDAATYARDAPSMAAQGAGQDLVDLVLVVPLLVVSLILMLRGSRIALFVFGGGVFYVLYSFFIYSFGVHFNRFFLVYCLILGTALYAFILVVLEAVRMPLEAWVGERAPVRSEPSCWPSRRCSLSFGSRTPCPRSSGTPFPRVSRTTASS
jgi:hypothetical protein